MRLTDSYRCSLFEQIAFTVWDDISKHHRNGMHCPETGITSSIITEIRESGENRNIGLWASPGIHEDVAGSDIDIFIESDTNEFHWYALQAKVLYQDQSYQGIHNKQQWEKLDKLQSIARCIPMFLFYNGRDPKAVAPQQEDKQYGCSIVPNEAMGKLSEQFKPIRYPDLHPAIAFPWRELVCTTKHRRGGRLYSSTEIKNAVKLYEGLLHQDILDKAADLSGTIDNEISIESTNETVGRKPQLTLVIRTSKSMRL